MITPKIEQRTWKTKNGKTVKWQVVYGENAKNRQRLTFDTQEEAAAKLAEMITQVNNGTYIKPSMELSVCDIAKLYIYGHCKAHCKPRTIIDYEYQYNNYFEPFFKDYRAKDMCPSLIDKFLAQDKLRHLSVKTKNNFITLLKSIYKYAKGDKKISDNPIAEYKKLKAKKYKYIILSYQLIADLLEAAKYNIKAYTLIHLGIYTGMRVGEVMAMKWDWINYDKKVIHVQATLYKGEDFDVKSETSDRYIDINYETIEILKKYQEEYGEVSDYVFARSTGNPYDVKSLYKYLFYPYRNKIGMQGLRYHDLRHTYASILIAQNLPITDISYLLGHASPTVTMNVYAHLIREAREMRVLALDKVADEVQKIRNGNVIQFPKQKIETPKSIEELKLDYLKENVIISQKFSTVESAIFSREYKEYVVEIEKRAVSYG